MKLYELKINEDELNGSEQGVYAISLVEEPAIEELWVAFTKEESVEKIELAQANDEQQTLIGAVLVPNKKILRRDPKTGEEYNIYFEPETIKKAEELYFKNKNNDQFTVDHKRPVNDVYVYESWIVEDENHDKSRAYGLDVPVGSWVVMAKVDNPKIWSEVKNGAYKGFSIEGLLKHNLKLAKVEGTDESLEDLLDQLMLAQMDEILEEEATYMLAQVTGVVRKDKRLKKGKRVELESYTDYPEAAKKAAKSAIERNAKKTASAKCGTAVGKIRAQQIAQGKPLSYETIKRVYAYLSRAEAFIDKSKPDYRNECASISYDLWGGAAMLPYARKVLRAKGDLKLSAVKLEGEKVSIDYDDTLSTARGKELAAKLMNEGKDVYIVTRRQSSGLNNDIERDAETLGIPVSKIIYTNGKLKANTLESLGIKTHYDNNQNELDEIAKLAPNVKGVKFASKEEQGPCQRGYVQRGYKDLDGRNVPNCIPDPDKKEALKLFTLTTNKLF